MSLGSGKTKNKKSLFIILFLKMKVFPANFTATAMRQQLFGTEDDCLCNARKSVYDQVTKFVADHKVHFFVDPNPNGYLTREGCKTLIDEVKQCFGDFVTLDARSLHVPSNSTCNNRHNSLHVVFVFTFICDK